MRRPLLVLGLVAGLAAGAPAAPAAEVDPSTFRDLAERAATDPDAVEALRRVDGVGGRPVDVDRALGDVEGETLARRLEALAASVDGGEDEVDADAARARAEEILSSDRYRGTDESSLTGRLMQRAGDWLAGLAEDVPVAPWVLWGVVAVVVVVGAAAVAHLLVRRRTAELVEEGRARRRDEGGRPDPRALERDAARAERAGDLPRAVRLLFLAGLLRLDARGVLDFRPSLTTGEAARRLGLASFDRLARFFDEVAYGGRPPSARSLDAVRRGWDRVLREAAR